MSLLKIPIVFILTCLSLSTAIHHGELKSPFRIELKRKHFHGEKAYAVDPADQLDARDIELAKAAFDVQDDAENERVKGDLQLGEEINKMTSQNTYFGPRFSDTDEEPLIKDGALRSSILKPRKHTKRKIVKKHIQNKTHLQKTTVPNKPNKKQKLSHNKKNKKSKTQKKSVVKKRHQKKPKKHAKKAKKHNVHHKHAASSTHKKLPALKKFYAKDFGDEGDDYIENYKPEAKEEGFDREKNENSEGDNIIEKMREQAGYGDNEDDEDRFDDGKSSFSRDNDDKSPFSRDNDEEEDEKEEQHEQEEEENEHEQHEDNDEDDDKDEDDADEEPKGFHNEDEEDQGIIKQSNDKMEVADNGLVFNQETGTINENLLKKNPSFGQNNGDTYVDDEMRNSGIDKKSKNGGIQRQVKQKTTKVSEKLASEKLTNKPKAAVKVKVSPVADQGKIFKKISTKAKTKPSEVKASKKSYLSRRINVDQNSDEDNDEENDDENNDDDLW